MNDPKTEAAESTYAVALDRLVHSNLPFMIGGFYAMREYAAVDRYTKDLDVFCAASDVQRLLDALDAAGFQTEMTDPSWIAKAFRDGYWIDVIFNSGNGVCRVEESWFDHARTRCVLGFEVKVIAPEELIWSKVYVQERERFDGADVLHVIREQGMKLDWSRLLERMGPHWEVLLAHLLNYRFVYPSDADAVPEWVMQELLDRARHQPVTQSVSARICRGPLLSRYQYETDIADWGYWDVRPSIPVEHNGQH